MCLFYFQACNTVASFQKPTDVYGHSLNDIKKYREHNFECSIISHRMVTGKYPELYRNPKVQTTKIELNQKCQVTNVKKAV